jgi:hypothetical protein
MSDLQNTTKPILIPLRHGRQITVSEPRQRQLATWVAMTVICAEYLQPASVATRVIGRRLLFTNRTPPNNMRIWIGNFDRQTWKAYWAHNSLRTASAWAYDAADAAGLREALRQAAEERCH